MKKENNYIDECLEEFGNIINQHNKIDINRISYSLCEDIETFLKQKLNQVVANERERIVDEFALMQHYTGGSSVEPKDLRINLKEAINRINNYE